MNKTFIENNKKYVKKNFTGIYELKHDWPIDTVWNVNGGQGECYTEVFINTPYNAKTYDAAHGKTHEECEDILWDRYQKYINCNHEFSKDHPKYGHYKNGAGFCVKCGIFKTNIFEPEYICQQCGKHANPYNKERTLCKSCYEKLSYKEKDNPRLLDDDFMLKKLSMNCTEITKISGDGYIKWVAILKTDNIVIDLTLRYVDEDDDYVKITEIYGSRTFLLDMYCNPMSNHDGVYYKKSDCNKLI